MLHANPLSSTTGREESAMNRPNEPQELTKTQGAAPAPEEAPYPPIGYAWFVVFILMIVYVFSFIDRQILGLLVGPIRADLGISDTQMSLLMGFSFALFYTFFGIPLGRLADNTRSRRTVIAVGLAVWSLMSAMCGVVRNYWQFLGARVGVGIGEAALSPSAYSLITDYFPPKRLGTAISIYGAGIYLGSGLAYLLGGYVAEFANQQSSYALPIVGEIRPWQLVFFIIGLPGLAFVAFVYLIKEPVRRGVRQIQQVDGSSRHATVPLMEVLSYIGKNRGTFVCHSVGFALLSFVAYGATSWIPTFFVRTYEWQAADAGKLYGAAVMLFGSTGILFGGIVGDWLAHKGYSDSKMRAAFFAAVLHVPVGLLYPIMPEGWMALAILCPGIFTLAMPFGLAPAAIAQMMPNAMRGQASALYLFVVNLIGLGIGPTAVALCTDVVFKDDMMLNYSLLIIGTIGNVGACFLLWAGLARFRESLNFLQKWQAENA